MEGMIKNELELGAINRVATEHIHCSEEDLQEPACVFQGETVA